jgi:radical SAM superfamily enzyme YgiQ (UPF0313 family)
MTMPVCSQRGNTEDLLAGATKCLLVQPRFSVHSFWNYRDVCQFLGAKYPAAPLGLMTVAALLPQHWQFRLVDENVRPLADGDLEWADMVLTGGMLPQQRGILTVIQRAHHRNRPVVVGGPDPTEQPHVYQQADFLVLGEGEVTIPPFMEDLGKHITSGMYQPSQRADMAQAVVPRFDLIRFADYLHVGVQFSRGCPFNCEFCDIIELFGRRPRTKTPDQILAELQALYDLGYRGHVDFVDDNFIGNKSKVAEVLQTIGEWSRCHDYPFYFSTEASVNLVKEEELLRLMQENDFRWVFVGIESPDEDVLIQTQKTQNKGLSAAEAVRMLNSHGMIVNGGFILGFDGESDSTAGNMINLIQETGIPVAMVGTLSALPDTQLSRRLKREGRLFSGGLIVENATVDIDQTTSGLNFATARPRTDILRDQMDVLRAIYGPRKYYERVLLTATQLRPAPRSRLSWAQGPKMVWAFLKVCHKAGLSRRTGSLYWRTLSSVLVRNPAALEAAMSLAAMYVHFSEQSEFVIRTLEERVATIERCGEEDYNRRMILGPEGSV